MSSIDELGRNAATALRARVESTLDVDDGLRSLGDTPLARAIPVPSHHPRRAWVVGTAAAAVIAIGVGVVVTDDNEATTPGTSDTLVETVAPTVASTDEAPDTTPVAPPSSTIEAATTTTVLVGADALLVVPDVGQRVPAPIDPCTPEDGKPCFLPLQTSYGMTVALTGPADITVTVPDGSSRVVALDEPVNGPLIALGPEDDVAYVVTQTTEGRDQVGRLLAFSLGGNHAGALLATSERTLDTTGDSGLIATAAGVTDHDLIGAEVRPDPAREPLLPWLRFDGSITAAPGPFTSYDPTTRTITLTNGNGVAIGSWVIPDTVDIGQGIPHAVFDGVDAIVSAYDWNSESHVVLRLRHDGGAQKITVPTGMAIAGWWGTTPVLHDGTAYWTWSVPGYTEPSPIDPIGLFGGTYGSADEALDAVVTELTTGDGCDVRPTATVSRRSGDNPVQATIEFTSLCDDSVVGGTYDVVLGGLSGAWEFVSVVGRGLCARGPSTDPRVCV